MMPEVEKLNVTHSAGTTTPVALITVSKSSSVSTDCVGVAWPLIQSSH